MKLSEIKQILTREGIQLTKSLGQNFLHDANMLRRIAEAGSLAPGEAVLEIGPGLGPLTELLVGGAGKVLAIEKDLRLVEVLKNRFPETPNLTLLHADALDWLREEKRDLSDWKMISNLPFSVASPILVELALGEKPPSRMVVTLQSEVAERLLARAGEEAYGLLSLLVQIRFSPAGNFRIPGSCFFPEPEVESSCVVLARRAQDLLTPSELGVYVKLVKRGFSQRRKMMMKLLKADWPRERLEAAFAGIGLDLGIRAERVTLEQFVLLTKTLTRPMNAA